MTARTTFSARNEFVAMNLPARPAPACGGSRRRGRRREEGGAGAQWDDEDEVRLCRVQLVQVEVGAQQHAQQGHRRQERRAVRWQPHAEPEADGSRMQTQKARSDEKAQVQLRAACRFAV